MREPNKLPAIKLWPQWIGTIGAWLTMIVIGLMLGWTSPYLAQLTAADSPLPITESETTWIASLIQIGRFIGAIVGSVTVEFFGTKSTLLVTNIPSVLAWICILFADSVPWLYAARLLSGLGFGASFSSFSLYLGEICDSKIRGASVSFAIGAFAFGTLVGNIMGAYIPMTTFAIIALVPNVLAIALFLYLPHSPHYLMRKGNVEGTEKSVLWYHRGVDLNSEMESLRQFVHGNASLSAIGRLRELTVRQNRKALVLVIILYMFMQFSGMSTLVFYLEILLTDAGVTIITPANMVMLVTALGIIAGWIAMYLIERFGRRVLMASSCAGVAVAMISFGVHFMLLEMGFNSTDFEWLAITSIITFQIFMSIGLIPVPSTILSELFPSNIKSIAACIASTSSALFGFISTVTFFPLINLIKKPYVFLLYACIMILGLVYTIVFVPETKGKTLQEIQDMLSKNNRKNDPPETHNIRSHDTSTL